MITVEGSEVPVTIGFNTEIVCARICFEAGLVDVTMKVRDRETGQPTHVSSMMEIPEGETRVAAVMRTVLLRLLEHEIDECIRENDVLVFDPHTEH